MVERRRGVEGSRDHSWFTGLGPVRGFPVYRTGPRQIGNSPMGSALAGLGSSWHRAIGHTWVYRVLV